MKRLAAFLIFLVAVGIILAYAYHQRQKLGTISTFEDCVKGGYPVMESYPGQCRTPDGRLFIQEIGNELEFTDLILVEHPRPNQQIASPLRVAGRARGTWFFEADFPIELVDANNKSLGIGHAQAQGEWMTEEFVPFEGKILFEKPETSTGKLIIRNANPSGLPENAKELIIPIVF